MKNKILKLREQGKTYKEICEVLGCSKSTVSYYCGKGQKEKTVTRNKKLREENTLLMKVSHFKHRATHRARDFQRRDNEKKGNRYGPLKTTFSYKDILRIYGENAECYLTGKKISLNDPKSYSFDHIIPASRGGDNSIKNLGICKKEINAAKSDRTVDEFIQLCKEVLEHNGYEITMIAEEQCHPAAG